MNERITTRIGKLVDKTSYLQIGAIILIVILASAFYYWFFNSLNHGTTLEILHWYNAIYFSIITFTTLGYGDIAPVGFGKVIASLEVISGLLLAAVFVGKLASERQSAMLLLIYTSVHQERLNGFVRDVNALEENLDKALKSNDQLQLNSKAEDGFNFISSIYKYLRFQANQGGLASYGNQSTLRKLYKAIKSTQLRAFEGYRIFGIEQRTRVQLERIIVSAEAIATVMLEFHLDDLKTKTLLLAISSNAIEFRDWKSQAEQGKAKYENHSEFIESISQRVESYLPAPPWGKNIHKKMARDLGISNSLAHSCISTLVGSGRWPQLKSKEVIKKK